MKMPHRFATLIVAMLAAVCGVAHAVPAISPTELVVPKVEVSGGNVILTVRPSVAGRRYKLEYSGTLGGDTWQDPGVTRVGDGNDLAISTPYTPGMPLRFYRLVLDGPPAAAPAPAGFEHIPAGGFSMGDALDGGTAALPVHTVQLSAFYMGKYEVTKALWDEVRTWGLDHEYTDLRTGGGKAANHPVQTISWYDMVKWCNARSEKEGLMPCYRVAGEVYKTTNNDAVVCDWSASGYRLPTEAEWEKAARGGLSGKRFPWGDTINHSYANYYNSNYTYESPQNQGYHPTWSNNDDGYYPYTSPVGSFVANGYGLYDMAGNVWEWCWDVYDDYTAASQVDPRGHAPVYGSSRVCRAGGWSSNAGGTCCASRSGIWPDFAHNGYDFGFRLARGQP